MKIAVSTFSEHRTAARQDVNLPYADVSDLLELRAAIGCTCCYMYCCCSTSCTAAIRAAADVE